jgi:hypothetical protein
MDYCRLAAPRLPQCPVSATAFPRQVTLGCRGRLIRLKRRDSRAGEPARPPPGRPLPRQPVAGDAIAQPDSAAKQAHARRARKLAPAMSDEPTERSRSQATLALPLGASNPPRRAAGGRLAARAPDSGPKKTGAPEGAPVDREPGSGSRRGCAPAGSPEVSS